MTAVGLGRLEISSLYSGVTLLAALALPVVGRWADRTDGGTYLGTTLAAMAAGLLLLGTASSVLQLGAALFLLRLLGQGAIGVGTLTLTIRWFGRHRGRAFAFVVLGYSLGEMLFPMGILGLFELVGWRGSLVVFAVAYGLVFAPFVARIGRDPHPGERAPEERASPRSRSPMEVPSRRLREAARAPAFSILVFALTLSPTILTAVIFHQVALFESFGGTAATASRAMIGFGAGSVAGIWAGGYLTERAPERWIIAVSLVALAAGLLWLWGGHSMRFSASIFGLILGASAGGQKVAGSLVWPTYFGPAHAGSIKGAVSTVRNAATALGPPLAALLAGPAGAFDRVLIPFAGAALVGAVAAALCPSAPAPERSREREGPPAEPSVIERRPDEFTDPGIG